MKATHVGLYETVGSTYNATIASVEAKGLVPAKDLWEICVSPPETAPVQIRTDVVRPIAA